jgi:hypothetical protein
MFSYIEHIKRRFINILFQQYEAGIKIQWEFVYLDRLMEVKWWMPYFVELANCFSILTLWLLGTSNKQVRGVISI